MRYMRFILVCMIVLSGFFIHCFYDTVVYADENAESFEVAPVFFDNMIFQQNEDIRVWGTSECEGKYISARLGESYGTSVVNNGIWEIRFAPRAYSNEPLVLEVYAGEGSEYVSFENIRIGDVWWIIGQSNVEFATSASSVWDEFERNLDGNSNVMIYEISNDKEKHKHDRWRRLNKYSAASSSALGCFFSDMLSGYLSDEIPLGIMIMGYSGAELAEFMTPELTKEGVAFEKGKNSIYNDVISHVEKVPVKGIVWYQGESDASVYSAYSDKLTSFIEWIREVKSQYNYNIPVYAVELPPCFDDKDDINRQYMDFGCVRGELGIVGSKTDNYFVCPTSDLWSERKYSNNLHPDNKMQISKRLVNMILSKEYGFGGTEFYFSPQVKSYEISKDMKNVTIKFTNEIVADKFDGFSFIGNEWNLINDVIIKQTSPDSFVFESDEEINIIRYNCTTDNVFGEDIFLKSKTGIPVPAFSIELKSPANPMLKSDAKKNYISKTFLAVTVIVCLICYFAAIIIFS